VGELCTRGKYLKIKKDAHELPWGISAFLPKKFKSLKKELVDPFLTTGTIKEANRDEGKFRASDKKFGKRLGISPGPDSSIISLISSFKIF
jgi:hypothetical protein